MSLDRVHRPPAGPTVRGLHFRRPRSVGKPLWVHRDGNPTQSDRNLRSLRAAKIVVTSLRPDSSAHVRSAMRENPIGRPDDGVRKGDVRSAETCRLGQVDAKDGQFMTVDACWKAAGSR